MKHTTNERLGRIERMVAALHMKINSLMRASDLTIELEFEQMADFTSLAEKVAKISGTVNSSKAVIQGLKAKIEEMAAGFNDKEDQAAIMALSAELAATETALAEAIAFEPVGSVG